MSTPWAAALEGLAEKRRHLTEAIVALSKVAGVDPAPYLGVPAFAVVDTTQPGGNIVDARPMSERLKAAAQQIREAPKKEPAPPRPQSPAPPTTNGAGLDDKVLQVLEGGPQSLSALSRRLKVEDWRLKTPLRQLIERKKVQRIGTGPRNLQYQLTPTT